MVTNCPKISVIVPMYNVERYLAQCVRSIQGQTLKDIEIILVDDGSPDNCGAIADQYAREDSRITVVHRENGGLGPARNSGIEIASGEYIGFVDSDDWIEPQMFEHLYAAAKACNADISCSGFQALADGETLYVKTNPFAGKTLSNPEAIFQLRKSYYGALPNKKADDPVPVAVWTNIYKKDFLFSNKIRFRNIRSEDKFFNTDACKKAAKVVVIADSCYNYRKDGQPSIMTSFSDSTVESYLELFKSLKVMAESEIAYREECSLRTQRCISDYTRIAMQSIVKSSATKKEKSAAIRRLANDSTIRFSVRGYPFRKLPLPQALFGIALRIKSMHFLYLLAWLGSHI